MDLEDIPYVLNLISALILIIIILNTAGQHGVYQYYKPHCTAVSNVYYTITFHIQSIMHSVYLCYACWYRCDVYCVLSSLHAHVVVGALTRGH